MIDVGTVAENLLALGIIIGFLYLVFQNMPENKMTRNIREFFRRE